MNKISCFFDRHIKTRIALQLVLDGLPFLSLAGLVGCACVVEEYEYNPIGEVAAILMLICAVGFLASFPIMILAARLRMLADVDFQCYPVFKIPSAIMRWLSFASTVLSIPVIFGLISNLF